MDKWMNGWVEWMDGRTDGRRDGCTGEERNGRWRNGQMDEWMDR